MATAPKENSKIKKIEKKQWLTTKQIQCRSKGEGKNTNPKKQDRNSGCPNRGGVTEQP